MTLFVPPPPVRLCSWCHGPIPAGARRDAVYCCKGCRQSAWRLGRGRGLRVADGTSLRLAFADPPYPGQARRYYAGHPDYAGEVDHRRLFRRLASYDGWVLCTSAEALPAVLRLAPEGTHVAAWLRGERPTPSYSPLNAWEPVLYRGGRAWLTPVEERRTDALTHHYNPRTSDPDLVTGAKPAAFAYWAFDLMGALPGDTLDDLFPGSGGVARCWSIYTSPGSRRRMLPDLDDVEPVELFEAMAE